MSDLKQLFDVVRGIAGRGLTQAEVDAINAALSPPTKHLSTLESPEFFFAEVRKVTGKLDQEQVDILNRLLAAAAHWSIGWLAYGLATAWHEARLKPIEEWGKGKGHEYGKVNQTGKAPYGRGLVQLTHHTNYARADKELHLNGTLVANYDRALEPDIAVQVLVRGMEGGWFTGKSLRDYIVSGLGTRNEFRQARRIINGTDKMDLIADHAEHFKDALTAGGWS